MGKGVRIEDDPVGPPQVNGFNLLGGQLVPGANSIQATKEIGHVTRPLLNHSLRSSSFLSLLSLADPILNVYGSAPLPGRTEAAEMKIVHLPASRRMSHEKLARA
jgi:hypothetical protein